MGLIIKGEWVDQWYDTDSHEGEFVRQQSRFRNWICGETGSVFKPEAGRYHLYVSLACPWAHRTLIFRKLKGLESMISVSVVRPLMLENGWAFGDGKAYGKYGREYGDGLYDLDYLYQLYLKAAPDYQGRVTVPVLWDKHNEVIVNNESADIIRMFNTAFNGLTGNTDDYYPLALRSEIDALNDRIYETVNNGVYRAGFATTQAAYECAYHDLFETLDWLEMRLAKQRYLLGDQQTEADWRLFTTLIRFDAVYHGHFKCNQYKISERPHLTRYLKELYEVPGVSDTVNMTHIKQHYYGSHKSLNPGGIIPLGPQGFGQL